MAQCYRNSGSLKNGMAAQAHRTSGSFAPRLFSYFCNADDCIEEWMKDVVDFDILPMLSEYWFDDSSKLQRWENILHGVFQ